MSQQRSLLLWGWLCSCVTVHMHQKKFHPILSWDINKLKIIPYIHSKSCAPLIKIFKCKDITGLLTRNSTCYSNLFNSLPTQQILSPFTTAMVSIPNIRFAPVLIWRMKSTVISIASITASHKRLGAYFEVSFLALGKKYLSLSYSWLSPLNRYRVSILIYRGCSASFDF